MEVRNAELPSRLRHCIAQRLLDAAAANFVSLLTSLPELVEAYQSTDTAGATVRRYAIINDDQQVPMPPRPAGEVYKSYSDRCKDFSLDQHSEFCKDFRLYQHESRSA